MQLLITGGTGFLGRHLVWHAARHGAKVIFTGRNVAAAATVLQQLPAKYAANVHWLPLAHGSAESQVTLQTAAQGCDAVVHAAALSAPWGRYQDFYTANVRSTEEVLTACHNAKVRRLLHVSTPSLYFGFADQLKIRENAVLPPPANDYVRTKWMAEQRVMANPLPETLIVRPRALFGPWDQTLMPRLLRVMAQGALPLMRGGKQWLDLTYIDNATDALWRMLTQPLPHRGVGVYNLSNGEPWQLPALLTSMAQAFDLPLRTRTVPWPLVSMLAQGMEMMGRLQRHCGLEKEPLLTRYSAGVLAFSQTLDISALQQDFAYHPQIGIAEGIRRHAAWWQQQNTLPVTNDPAIVRHR
jgi:nucleoside-diphosphate-sugar epimerase